MKQKTQAEKTVTGRRRVVQFPRMENSDEYAGRYTSAEEIRKWCDRQKPPIDLDSLLELDPVEESVEGRDPKLKPAKAIGPASPAAGS
jgi:hypothetical protein